MNLEKQALLLTGKGCFWREALFEARKCWICLQWFMGLTGFFCSWRCLAMPHYAPRFLVIVGLRWVNTVSPTKISAACQPFKGSKDHLVYAQHGRSAQGFSLSPPLPRRWWTRRWMRWIRSTRSGMDAPCFFSPGFSHRTSRWPWEAHVKDIFLWKNPKFSVPGWSTGLCAIPQPAPSRNMADTTWRLIHLLKSRANPKSPVPWWRVQLGWSGRERGTDLMWNCGTLQNLWHFPKNVVSKYYKYW